MASVVFFRAANVGGHQVFRPALLAKELAALDVVNVGAAGTYVVRKAVAEPALRKAILSRLDFAPELLIRPAKEVQALEETPFGRGGEKRSITVMTLAPKPLPRLPLDRPEGKAWSVRIVAIEGVFAYGLRRQ